MTHFRSLRLAGLPPILLLAGGCTAVGPDYHPPHPDLPATYGEVEPAARGTGIDDGADGLGRWWRVFHDPELDSLIDQAIRGNRDLKEAVSRVRQARAQREIIDASLWPEANATAGYDRARGSKNVVLPLGALAQNSGGSAGSGAAAAPRSSPSRSIEDFSSGGGASSSSSAPPGGPASPFGEGGLPGVTTSLYQAGFDASWEFDLFGGTRRAIEAANAEIGSADEARRAVLTSLLAEVADIYLGLRTGQQRLAIARENLAAQNGTLGIARAKQAYGLGTSEDVDRQSAQAAMTAATIPALESAVRNARHTLAFLIGEPPNALDASLPAAGPLPPLPARLPPEVPSDLLRRRPDIRGAERALAAATAEIGVAQADLFPKFSLTGSFGWDSSQFKNLPDWGSRYYSIAPGISWPILDWGRIRANIRVQNEAQHQSLLKYEDTVAQALKEVADALVNYETEQTRRSALADGMKASDAGWDIARQRYREGLTDMLSVLDAERSFLAAQDALAASDGALRTDLIALYKALGGGWESGD